MHASIVPSDLDPTSVADECMKKKDCGEDINLKSMVIYVITSLDACL